MIKKTFKEIRDFNLAAGNFSTAKPTNMDTKFGYALRKVTNESIQKVIKEFQEARMAKYYDEVESVQIEHALVDKVTKAVLTSEKGSDRPYLYDKQGLRAVMAAERKFTNITEPAFMEEWDEKEFDINPHFVTELPEDVLDVEPFLGFVIDPAEYVYELPTKQE